MKSLYRALLAVCLLMISATGTRAAGWPANWEGVMLQAFYWDSYEDTKWTNLTAQADELSQYFKLLWIPNSAKSATGGMGYDPVYWFTNHNTKFGTQFQIRNMITTFKEKGTGVIGDVILNHRSGRSGWTDFPSETWNGQTWHIGLDGICCTDEVNRNPNEPHGTGAPDTGDDFDGSRDLDHTNANVQNNCKNYCKFLLEEMGYAGFRLDMVKGYAPQYTKMYNQYSNPTYCVGEYWDGSYDALAAWIEGTGKTSAVFDYSFKYAVNKAFSSKNYNELVWMANGSVPQPAGLIHYGYPQYAVTFIENHDTDGNGTNAFSGNIVAANAFMICSPGTPCVFLKHWKQYKSQIKKIIEARNLVGVHNMSQVNVLRHTSDCYMAEVVGTKGRLVIKIGSAMVSPSGYNDSQIYCSGTDYCIWTTTTGGNTNPDPNPDPNPNPNYPATLYLQGHVNGYDWSTSQAIPASGTNGKYTYTNVTIDNAEEGYGFFAFCTTVGASWDVVNASTRYGASAVDEPLAKGGSATIVAYTGDNAGSCLSWKVAAGTYTIVADLATMKVTITDGNPDPNPTPDPNLPAKLYLQGNVNGYDWSTTNAMEATQVAGVYKYHNVTVDDAGAGSGYFSFCTVLGVDWDEVNSGDRYGASSADELLGSNGAVATIVTYPANVSASSCAAWMIAAGVYDIEANLATKTLTVSRPSGIENIGVDYFAVPVYYNMMGVEVKNPSSGLYIVRRGNSVTKELVK